MAENKEASKGLNILSIDGGGIGGLSSLFVLDQIMKRIHELEDGQEPPKPVDYFDVIAGTGVGGISACMLGRLGMSTDEAIKAFIKLANTGFLRKYIGTSGQTMYKGTALRNALKAMVHDAVGDENAAMQTENQEHGCKTQVGYQNQRRLTKLSRYRIVFAMSKHHVDPSVPVLFRSYLTRSTDTASYSIWEALYATMARPDLFKSIDIVYESVSQPFICAELGCGNPIAHVLTEVRALYPDRQVSCILSVGSGQARTVHIPKPNIVHRVLWTSNQTAAAVTDMAMESGDVEEQMAARFQNTTQFYYRFNVDQGLQMMKDDWEQQSEVKAHTMAYTKKIEVGRMMSHAVKSVKAKANVLPVRYVDGTIQAAIIEEAIVVKECPAPTPVFTGREDIVRQVGNCIAGHTNERRVCVLHGMGGVGKTQIALKAIQLNRESWEHVLYVDASSKKAVEGALSDVAKAREVGKTFQDALNWLGSCHKPWLLVLDSADHPSLDIRHYVPRGDYGSILITTRRPALGVHAYGPESICHVLEMSETDALTLFFKAARVQVSSLDAGEMDATHALLKEFGYLALAIVQAGAYIAYSFDISISQYRQRFLERKRQMLEQYIALGELVKLDDYGRSVYTTFELCFDLLQENGDARSTLWLIAYLHHDDIRQDIFRRAAVKVRRYTPRFQQTIIEQEGLEYIRGYLSRFLDSNGDWDPTQFSNAINELASYSLVEFDPVNQSYRMHILVQEWARRSNPQREEMALECSTLLLAMSVDWSNTIESLAFTRKLRRHVEGLLPKDTRQLAANHAWGFGQVYVENGNWNQAAAIQTHLLEVVRQQLGEEHPDTLTSMNDLASTYESQGHWGKAQALHERVLDASKRVLGEEHPDTLTSMNNLAGTYRSRGQWDEAQALQEQVLDASKRVLGEEHPNTLTSMNNLASTYESRGQWDEAQALHERVLDASKRVLGEEHPDTLTSMNNLAITYQSRGQWDKAQALHEQVLDASKRVLGEEHPDTLTNMDNLASTYESRGQWDKAQALREQVLDASKRVLGEEHPNTLTSMNNLASTYESRGQWDEAQALHERVLDASKRVLGEEHPDTLAGMNNLAITYQSRGQWDEAQALHEQVLDASKRVLGEEHPDTLAGMNNLAITYQSRGQWDKAQALHEQVLDAHKRVLGEEHPNTLTSMNNLASTYESRGQWDKAHALREQVLDARKRVLGEEHPDTLSSMNRLASLYAKLGRFGESEQLAAAVDARKHIVGEHHEIAVQARKHLEWLQSRKTSEPSASS